MATTTSRSEKRLASKDIRVSRESIRRAMLATVIGPLVFNLTWLILGFLSPGYILFDTLITPYSPISQPISGLGLGVTGPWMNATFILCGILLLIGIFTTMQSLRANGRPFMLWTCAALLSLSPLGLIIDGAFTLEAVFPHLMGFLLATASPVLGFLVTGLFLRRIPGWQQFGKWMMVGSPLTLVLVVLFFLAFDPMASGAGIGIAGLVQRILVIEVHAWFVALGWLTFRRTDRTGLALE